MMRVPWSIEEAVILHDAYMQIIHGAITRKKAIMDVSEKLRKMAESKGITIDEKYRNPNGIAIQLSIMEYVITDGQKGIAHPPKIFKDAADLFKHNYDEYQAVLSRGNIVDNDKLNTRMDSDIRNEFESWMSQNGLSHTTARIYGSSVKAAEKYAVEHSFAEHTLFTFDKEKCQRTASLLLQNEEFTEYDRDQHHRFSASIRKLLQFLGIEEPDFSMKKVQPEKKPEPAIDITPETKEQYEKILLDFFAENGYQVGRAIVRGRFKRYYQDTFDCPVAESDEMIDQILTQVGKLRDGRVYPKQEDNTDDQLIASILNETKSLFDEGISAVYVESLFDKHRQELADQLRIYSAESLASVILEHTQGQYQIKWNSHFTPVGKTADVENDLQKIVAEFHEPATREEIYEKAWFIQYDRMKYLLSTNKALINMTEGKYLYAPNLPITAAEQKRLIQLLTSELQSRSYLTDTDLHALIQQNLPSFAINTAELPARGVRDCLGYLLRDYFTFNGPIITEKGKVLKMADVFAEYARYHEELSLNDIEDFAAEMNTPIYWDSVLNEMIRVSKTRLIRKDQIQFDVQAIDETLDGLLDGDYATLKDVGLFYCFPNIGYAWNHYLLESYVYLASEKFQLFHVSFGKSDTCGVIARKDSDFHDYHDIVVDALSGSQALQSKDSALQFLVDNGYQSRRRLEGIERILQEAKLLKEKKENE